MSPKDYQQVFKGEKIKNNSQHWRVFSIENNQNTARLGLSIAKKVLNRAVDRNRFKRLAREFFRINRDKLAQRDFVVMVNKDKTNKRLIDNKTLTLELSHLF